MFRPVSNTKGRVAVGTQCTGLPMLYITDLTCAKQCDGQLDGYTVFARNDEGDLSFRMDSLNFPAFWAEGTFGAVDDNGNIEGYRSAQGRISTGGTRSKLLFKIRDWQLSMMDENCKTFWARVRVPHPDTINI
jgi:hypothetical protein